MAAFPKLKTGAVAQYPSSVRVERPVKILRFLDGSEQRYREAAIGTRLWILQLDQITEEEMAAVEDFFITQQGKFGSFSFTDPWNGIEYADCSFDADSLQGNFFGESWAATQLVIRCNETK